MKEPGKWLGIQSDISRMLITLMSFECDVLAYLAAKGCHKR